MQNGCTCSFSPFRLKYETRTVIVLYNNLVMAIEEAQNQYEVCFYYYFEEHLSIFG